MAEHDPVRVKGWRLWQGAHRACDRCGGQGLVLYQGRRLMAGGWEDVPETLLCEACRAAHVRAQRRALDAAPPVPWWRFWSRRSKRPRRS